MFSSIGDVGGGGSEALPTLGFGGGDFGGAGASWEAAAAAFGSSAAFCLSSSVRFALATISRALKSTLSSPLIKMLTFSLSSATCRFSCSFSFRSISWSKSVLATAPGGVVGAAENAPASAGGGPGGAFEDAAREGVFGAAASAAANGAAARVAANDFLPPC